MSALFISAFLAATVLPFSSEAALFGALAYGIEPDRALLAASAGNGAAVLLNYFLGYLFSDLFDKKLHSFKNGLRAKELILKYGTYSLLLTPLPIIGDPLTIAAGLFRTNLVIFFLIVVSLRVLRYFLIIFLYNQAL